MNGLNWTPAIGAGRRIVPVLGPHEMFHLAVLAGIACHWAFILGIASGEPTPAGAETRRA